MEYITHDKLDEPFSVTVRPSIRGGRFIVRTSQGPDFVGDRAMIFGVSEEDIAALQAGDRTILGKYMEPSGEQDGVLTATDDVVDLDVFTCDVAPIILRAREFQEVVPFTGL